MSSSTAPGWASIAAQEYAAAESMLQHSRSARSNSQALNGFSNPHAQSYGLEATQAQQQLDRLTAVSVPPYAQTKQLFPPANAQDHAQGFNASFESNLSSPHDIRNHFDQQGRDLFSELSHLQSSSAITKDHQMSLGGLDRSSPGRKNSSNNGSEPTSPISTRAFVAGRSYHTSAWTNGSNNDNIRHHQVRDGSEKKPPWTELKTKAGKERKRLPLACIACRRKKIRCSGEKPTCMHCLRARVPCVYKVTARKVAPRIDYMAMLDKRLKRMEERVIKVIPKEEMAEPTAVPRAVIKPSSSTNSHIAKKRSAEQAFGSQVEEWANSNANSQPLKGRNTDESNVNTEGVEHLPSAEIREHLSELFFDYLYGQAYHLLHKPSYMRRLRAGTVPPVLILAVCAISARFSTHPRIVSEPAFLRGESWASPAREISLRRYDEPNITTLTVYLLLGLHEFGTCQGGRSWMFAGMATRMAYALQLHRELDHDPLGRKNGKKSELSCTDREIRRRTMWACFLMDRFNSSGTERPMFADEAMIKIQLPIKESKFQMGIPGSTESLDGRVPNPTVTDTGQLHNPKENMGVAAYMIRVLGLWGRVIQYLNMGGKERDKYPIWDPQSHFTELRKEAEDFKESLPDALKNTSENLMTHATEKLANQFVLMHIASNQVILFLHRFAIPTAPGARNPKEIPKTFVAEAGPAAINAANQISTLLNAASNHHAVAPFLGYCAFLSSTVHVWGIFSKHKSLETSCKNHLAKNIKFLTEMKKYWGMFHFVAENLRDIYRQHAEASLNGSSEAAAQDTTIFQYGDWFQKYPHGVSETDYQDPAAHVKRESEPDAALSHQSDLQSVEDFFHTQPPPSRMAQARKPANKNPKSSSQSYDRQAQVRKPEFQAEATQQGMLPMSAASSQSSIDPSAFATPHPPQLYPQPCNNSFPQAYDLLTLPTPANTALIPQLDRHLVYGADAGVDPSAASSASALNELVNMQNDPGNGQHDMADPNNQMWNHQLNLSPEHQQQLMGSGGFTGNLETTSFFIPFNMDPPEVGGEGDEFTNGLGSFNGTSG